MNNTHTKTEIQTQQNQVQVTASGGEASKKQFPKNKNPKTVAAKEKLIEMSQAAQDILDGGVCPVEFMQCEKINDVLLVMHQLETGCKVFKTFNAWREEGYKVIKGSSSYRVWGSPLKAKKDDKTAPVVSGESETEKTFKFWPMCSLFNESQVEKIEDKTDSGEAVNAEPVQAATVKPEPVAAVEVANNEELKAVPVADFRDAIEHLERIYNNDRHSCVGVNEREFWKGRAVRAMDKLKGLTCKRAKPKDFEKKESIILRVTAYLNENPTPPKGTKKTEAEPVKTDATPNNDNGEKSGESIESAFVTNDYQERQESKKERFEERAAKKRIASTDAHKRSRELVEHIPFGQPILVGHHSEAGHRRTIDKSWNALGKAVKLDGEADTLESRAVGVGTGGIATNDPAALDKLNEKLAKLVESQQTMKAANKAIKAGNNQALIDLGLNPEKLKAPDFAGRVGFPSYRLTNNNAEINRLKKRIASIKKLRTSKPLEFECDAFNVGVDNGQIVINFTSGKPSDEVRTHLKGAAFKWSRYQSAWVRKATENALYTADSLLGKLKNIAEIY